MKMITQTLTDKARMRKMPSLVKKVAKEEHLSSALLLEKIANGKVVILKNRIRDIPRPCGVGELLRTKVNTNIGTSMDNNSISQEIKKLHIAIQAGTDTVMDLSTGKNLKKVLKTVLKESCVPVGTVPIYEVAVDIQNVKRRRIKDIDEKMFFDVMERQASEGVDFFTIHSGVTLQSIERLRNQNRLMDLVSRGGAILVEWMMSNNKENPYYERFEEVLRIARQYDITISLGDGMRPGALCDGTDRPQIQELVILGELAKKARDKGVGVMIEGPGHIRLDQISLNVKLEKSLCDGAPFYLLGPLVTDIAPGYDHITSAIGGAIAASCGADFLCYVTPSEHIRLPSIEDVRIGVVSAKIAAHAADIVKGIPYALQKDIEMSKARKRRDWELQFNLAIEPNRPRAYRKQSKPKFNDTCTMCSKYCSMRIIDRYLSKVKS